MIYKVEIDEKMYKSIQLYMTKKGKDTSEIDNLIKQGAVEGLNNAFKKYVPKAVRDYIELENSLSEKKKSVSHDTPITAKEEDVNEQSELDRQSN